MKFSQASKMAISTIRSNKLRTFLTMLGIIIGVMAVTLLVSLVEGATNKVTDSMNDLGGDELVVQITSTTKRLTLHEVESLEGSSGIQYVSPTIQGSDTAVAEGNSHDVSVVGITDRYGDVQGLDILNGRTFTQTDTDNRLNVAIIGYGTAEDLYGTTDVLEQNVHVLGRDYRIVGVLKDKEDSIAGSVNDTIYIPLTNAQRWLKSVSIQSFYVSARQDRLNEAQSHIRSFLMDKYGDDDNFSVVNMADVMDVIDQVMGTLELLLGAIAGISLVVGGIGIMNIMLVSVTERTREIGIRKAIGAQKSDIVVQFLIESAVISLMGGVIGMALSQLVLTVINLAKPGYSFAISGSVAAVALGFSIFVGIVFGIYPAAKAASLKPINALRYE